MAKAERKNTICPTGYRSLRKRTSVAITANSSADITLSKIAWTTFMCLIAHPRWTAGWWGWSIDHAGRERKPPVVQARTRQRETGLTQPSKNRVCLRAGRAECSGLRLQTGPTENPRGHHMPHYIVLGSFTEQGLQNIKDSPKRAEAVSKLAKKVGASLKDTYWTLGQYDFVAIIEAPDDVTMTALGATIGKLGNVRTETLRAFTGAELKSILAKIA